MRLRTVRLELLRPGPPHNQLLSPLTSYIALCGDEPPETLHVPFEHYQILQRIQALRPPRSPSDIQAALTELREDIVRMLCGIRCLATSLAEAHGDGVDLIELELVLSASELSLIPFEIAFYPGSPTRELAHREVIVMRRSRRVPRGRLWWEHRPRVLVAAASPPGLPAVPLEAHLRGLREALAPWLTYLDGYQDEPDLILRELKKFCVVLPNASELSIQETIAAATNERHPFTHVHILAHGGEVSADDDDPRPSFAEPRFGLVLHDSHDPRKRDTLSGRRTFAALAASNQQCERKLPQVVTLASCDSANIGGVVVPGASIAHDIHDGGVPLVIASQFPLSYLGSVVFVRRIYERLLAGDDPRCALRETRRSILAAASRDIGPVDWGSVVQYGALPSELDKHVVSATIRAAKQRVDAALSSVDDTMIPTGKSDLVRAWKHACEGLEILSHHRSDPDVDLYIARVHLRWAFIVRNKKVDMASATHGATAARADPNQALQLDPVRSIRLYRDGMLRHYRATNNSVSLVEMLLSKFYIHEPLPVPLATAAATQCHEKLQYERLSKEGRCELERALISLWILAPAMSSNSDPLATLDDKFSLGPDANWFASILQEQFLFAPPTDFGHFTLWRQCQRIAEVAAEPAPGGADPAPGAASPPRSVGAGPAPGAAGPLPGGASPLPGGASPLPGGAGPAPGAAGPAPSAGPVAERALRVAAFLEVNGVRKTFSAIVDWRDEGDGGVRTIAT